MEKGTIGTVKDLPKIVEVTIIYPCRVSSADEYIAKDRAFGEKVNVDRDDAMKLFGMNRAVLSKDFNEKEHKMPANKVRKGTEPPPPPPKK